MTDQVPRSLSRRRLLQASWSAPAPLSELSVAQRSASVSFPDFTRGDWSRTRG